MQVWTAGDRNTGKVQSTQKGGALLSTFIPRSSCLGTRVQRVLWAWTTSSCQSTAGLSQVSYEAT